MQSTIPDDLTEEEAIARNKLRREFFEDSRAGMLSMDARLSELEIKGEKLVRREKVLSTDPCPCGSGRKFRACCFLTIRK